jgi:hypothetical protein
MPGKMVFALIVMRNLSLYRWKATTLIRGLRAVPQRLKTAKCFANHAIGVRAVNNRGIEFSNEHGSLKQYTTVAIVL